MNTYLKFSREFVGHSILDTDPYCFSALLNRTCRSDTLHYCIANYVYSTGVNAHSTEDKIQKYTKLFSANNKSANK
jgi:hypothetical protein